MIQGKSVIAVIPARGGSKRLPGKNIKLLAGKPLIAWSIDEAHKSKYIDRLIVSTDSREIAKVAENYHCEVPFIRPEKLSEDDTSSNEVVCHALDNVQGCYDIVMILQPTSPLRKAEDIDDALEFMIQNQGEALVSVCETSKPLHWYHTINSDGILRSCIKEGIISLYNDQQNTYIPNGALFMVNIPFFEKNKSFYTEKTLGYLMPSDRSIDIDSYVDFIIAYILLSDKIKK